MFTDKQILEQLLDASYEVSEDTFIEGLTFWVLKSEDDKLHAGKYQDDEERTTCKVCNVENLDVVVRNFYSLLSTHDDLQPCIIYARPYSTLDTRTEKLSDLIEPLKRVSKLEDVNISEVKSFEELQVLLEELLDLAVWFNALEFFFPQWGERRSLEAAISTEMIDLINSRFSKEVEQMLKPRFDYFGESELNSFIFVNANRLRVSALVRPMEIEAAEARAKGEKFSETKSISFVDELLELFLLSAILSPCSFNDRVEGLGFSHLLLCENWKFKGIETIDHGSKPLSNALTLSQEDSSLLRMLSKQHLSGFNFESHQVGLAEQWVKASLASLEALK